ncbi:fibronectin type III domain-containing protein [Candidatus Poriferisodalis sp.]|uniref:fibronectin type III domain-containing protein n=1 Tax=Candidatus Poriferisodalis sp. TaxID=3101277 RepID=UPI003B58FB68
MTASRRLAPLPLPLIGLLALLALVLGGVLLWSTQAEAQSQRDLVGNLNQANSDTLSTGGNDHAQLFRTAGGDTYTLTHVFIDSGDAEGDDFDVEICEADTTDDEFPTADCTALTVPVSFAAELLLFSHDGLALSANTNYVVVIKQRGTGSVTLNTTTSAGEDATGLTGWNIKNKFDWNNGGTWQQKSGGDEAFFMNVRGYRTPNQDATGLPRVLASAEGAHYLFADTVGIADANGLPFTGDIGDVIEFTYSYQWIRVDGANETDIGTDSPRYELVDDDIGKLIKVEVSFTDRHNYSESVTSLPFGPVTEPAGPSQTRTLVSNTGQSTSATAAIAQQYAMEFMLGSHGQGYEISSVSIELAAVPSSGLTVSLWIGDHSSQSGEPETKLFDFKNPPSFVVGANKFTAPAGVIAYPGVKYNIVLSGFGASLSIKETTSDAEDAGGEAGAELRDTARVRALSETGRWGTSVTPRDDVLRLAVEGSRRASGILASTYAQPWEGDQEVISIGDICCLRMGAGEADRYLVRGFSWRSDDTTELSGGITNPWHLLDGTSDTSTKLFRLINTRHQAGITEWTAPQGATVAGGSSNTYTFRQDLEDPYGLGVGTRTGQALIRIYGVSEGYDAPTAPGVTLSDHGDVATPHAPMSAVLGVPLYAMAQNLGQTDNSYVSLGGTNKVLSQGFTTGPDAGRFELRGIGINIEGSGSNFPDGPTSVSVAVHASTGGEPGAKLFDLVSPTEYGAGHSFFEAPPRTTLEASTTYVMVWSHLGGTEHRLQKTSTDSEDSGAASGFSIANVFYQGADLANLVVNGDVLEIAVYTNRDFTPPKRRVTGFDLHSDNADPEGVWGNDDTIWVVNDGLGAAGNKIFAYKRVDGSRDSGKDFETLHAAGNRDARGMCSDGTTMFVADSDDDKVYAYKMSDESHDSAKDITLAAANSEATGVWCNAGTIWVANDATGSGNKVFAYKRSDRTHDSAKDMESLFVSSAAADENAQEPRGLWSNATTMFATDSEDDKVYAFKLSDESQDSSKNIALDSGNDAARGLWFDGRVLWVVDATDDKLYAYDLPGAQPGNDPADGAPAVTGALFQGETLTADTSGITDATDGLAYVYYHYQWIRIDGADVTELDGETGPTYTTTADDVDNNIQVRVVFDDDPGYREYPRYSPQVTVAEVPPEVTSVALTSTPGGDSTYAIGDSVTATVTFDKAVDITGSPQLTLLFGTTDKTASCAAATNTTTMACSYTVVAGDTAPSGVGIKANSLVLNSGTIYATGSTTNSATRTHLVLALQSGHKVDGIRPTLVITGSDAPRSSTDGTKIILTFSKDLSNVDRTKIKVMEGTTTLSTTAASSTDEVVTVTLATALLSTSGAITVELDADAVTDVPGNGNLAQSSTSVMVNLQATPLAPTDLAATAAPDETPQLAVTLTWTPPASDGGSAITSHQYRYYRNSGSFGNWTTIFNSAANGVNATSFTVKGLSAVNNAGTTFTFEVRAINANGSGTESDQATATIDAPSKPGNLEATAGDGQVALTWTTPDNFGSRILRYEYSVHDSNLGIFVVNLYTTMPGSDAGTTDFAVTSLTNGHQHTIGVRAVNTVGPGFSQLLHNVVPATFPTAPSNLRAEPGDQQVRLIWAAPTFNGGVAIDGYEYQQRTGNGAYGSWTDISGADENTTEHTVTGLTNGTSYSFKVRAKNPVGGEGPASNEVTEVPVTVPSAPQGFDATAGNAKARLDWSAPASDGGNPIVGYEYRYRAGSGSFTAWADVPGSNVNTTFYFVTGLVNGTVHTFEVRARTATLKGAAASDTATPMAVAPDAPSVTVESRNTALYVTWSVADDGGSDITEYQVQWKSGSQSFDATRQQAGITGRSTTITGLTNETEYQVRVRARNTSSWSGWSTVRNGTPRPKPAPKVTITADVTEPVTGPFRVTFTFTDTNLAGDESYDVVGFEAADIGAWYTSEGTESYEFQITDFHTETPGQVYSALVDDVIDGKLWIDVPGGAVQSSNDGQDNVFAFETWQVDAPDPAPAPEGAAIWSETLTVGGQYPDGLDTGHMGYFVGWSKQTGRDERFGALTDNSFSFGGGSREVLELSYTPGWRLVRLRLCPRPIFAPRTFELRLGDDDKWLEFHGENMRHWDFGRTIDGVRQQCRGYDWGPVILDWEHGDSITVRITR